MPKDPFYLGECLGQCVSVVVVFFKRQGANENVAVPRFGEGGLGAKFVFFVIFALAHAINVRLVQAVYFVFVAALLFEYTLVETQSCLVFLLLRFVHLALYFS